MYGDVRRRTLQILNYMLLTVVANRHNCVAVRRRTVQRNMPHKSSRACRNQCAVEIKVLDYNVAVYVNERRRTALYVV